MDLKFSELIDSIEAELSPMFLPNAFSWIDNNCDQGWTKAMIRFETALKESIRTHNYSYLKIEGALYKNQVLKLLKIYRDKTVTNETEDFLKNIQTTMGL